MSGGRLRLGTRASALALAQATAVAAAIRAAAGRDVEIVEISTYGDRVGGPLTQVAGGGAGTGVFVSDVRARLADGAVDLAVHSLKDLPTGPAAGPAAGLALAAVPTREDPRDVLVSRVGAALVELAPGSRIGTGSPRRAAQLRALRLGLDVVPVRGNVDTRLRKVADGELDAVVLARAGLARLDRLAEVTEVIDPMLMLPAPGQGALAIECRADDAELIAALAALDDPAARAETTAERALLAALEAGCTAPVGAAAELAEGDDGPELYLRGCVVAIDGSAAVRDSITGRYDGVASAEALGRRLAGVLLEAGAAELMVSGDQPAQTVAGSPAEVMGRQQ